MEFIQAKDLAEIAKTELEQEELNKINNTVNQIIRFCVETEKNRLKNLINSTSGYTYHIISLQPASKYHPFYLKVIEILKENGYYAQFANTKGDPGFHDAIYVNW